MCEWKNVRAADFVEFNPRLCLKKGTIATKVSMDKLQPFTKKIPVTEKAEYIGGSKFSNGDTIMARITPCLENGKTAFVDILDNGKIGFGSTEFIVMRAIEGISDPQFVYYLATSPEFRNVAIKSMVGSSGRQRVQQGVLENMLLCVPNLAKQVKIGKILSTFDQMIALNNQKNDNLERQMQAVYTYWFVNYEPFNGQMPMNWQKTDIYSIANIIYGAPFSSKLFNTDGIGIPIIRIRDLKDQSFVTYTTEKHPKGYLIKPGDIVVGMDGEFRPYIWGNTQAWLNQRVCIFESKNENDKAFVLLSIKPLLNLIEQTQVGTTVIHIGKKDFDTFEIILPERKILDDFGTITTPMINQIVNNRLENKRLAALRDSLLPKLMSGELDVSEIEL